jgi:exodeoxyribonuclease III
VGGEGRLVTIEVDEFYLVTCYVPNSGENLKRLDYRLNIWDPFLRNYLNELRNKKPVIFNGDLNVAHLDLDIYNYDAKHIMKQAGLTPQERKSFGVLLESTGMIDVLRRLYPGRQIYTN